MSEPLERDTLFKRLRSKPENKASQQREQRARGITRRRRLAVVWRRRRRRRRRSASRRGRAADHLRFPLLYPLCYA